MPQQNLSKEELQRLFADPPAEYSDFVTWFWEAGELSKEQITWQLEQLKAKGMGGTWFYPRFLKGEAYGTYPTYFSEEWWEMFRHSVAEHERLGLKAWFAGWEGRGHWRDLLREDSATMPELKGQRLVIHEARAEQPGQLEIDVPDEERVLSASAYRLEDGRLDGKTRQDASIQGQRISWEAPEGGWLLTVVASQPNDLDYTNRAVADRWIDIYWKPHEEKLRQYVGDTLSLYGQDEMCVLDGNILFSDALLSAFKERKGYDPTQHLAGLFYDIGQITDNIRCDYYEVMSALVEENLYKPLADWHHERGMQYGTIATWGRQDPLGHVWHYGDFSRLMRHFDVTGNEDPGPNGPGLRCFVDAKFSSSMLHIYRKSRAGMCVYWGSGWGMTQEQNIAWTNENFAYGMNLYNQHGGLYSMLGGVYQWVPPTIHFRQPYWEHWQAFVKYVSRLSAVMSQGVHSADVAILYPLTTIHANWVKGIHFTGQADEAASATVTLADEIYTDGIDFDFIDDHVLAEATIHAGKLKLAGMEFRVVVLPPMTTIRLDILEKLKAFFDAGGTVISFRRLPSASQENGRDDPKVRELCDHIFAVERSEHYEHSTQTYSQAGMRIQHYGNDNGGKSFFIPSQGATRGAKHLNIGITGIIRRAIIPDVRCGADPSFFASYGQPDIYHTHQKVGDTDVYFLFNLRSETRDVDMRFRLRGEPEIWDTCTGESVPVHRFAIDDETTTVRLKMDRNQGVVLVFSPQTGRPEVLADDLTEIIDVQLIDNSIEVRGLSEAPGRKQITLRHQGQVYRASVDIGDRPEPVVLGTEWDFTLQPTMDNRWGDFRWPASAELIGPEAREFRCLVEPQSPPQELCYHEPDFDDASWAQLPYSFGPYWNTIGPFPAGREPQELAGGELSPGRLDESFQVAGQDYRWQPHVFSRTFGADYSKMWGSVNGIADELLIFEATGGDADATRYAATTAVAPKAGQWDLHLGAFSGEVRAVWINGKQIFAGRAGQGVQTVTTDFSAPSPMGEKAHREFGHTVLGAKLKRGRNEVLVELCHTCGCEVRAFAVLLDPSQEVPSAGPPAVPLQRWFRQDNGLIYDAAPAGQRQASWLRFQAPPGTRAINLTTDARKVRAWVNGKPAAIRKGQIRLRSALKSPGQVALRIEHKTGFYAAAALPEPVRFECEPTKLPLGDWCNHGLAGYSGGVVYGKNLRLKASQLSGRVILDLGMANTTAEVVVNGRNLGVGMGRPYRFDITEAVREGDNRIEVKVFNTLANYFNVGPLAKDYVFEGQTLSGLIGPVTLSFPAQVTLTARETQGA